MVEEEFAGCSFSYSDDWEADVEDISVTSSRTDEVSLIEVDEHHFILTLAMVIEFRADVSGTEDPPDFPRTYRCTVRSTASCNVSFEVRYDLAKEEAVEVKNVLFDDGRHITVHDSFRWQRGRD